MVIWVPQKKIVWAAPKIFFAKILNEPREGR